MGRLRNGKSRGGTDRPRGDDAEFEAPASRRLLRGNRRIEAVAILVVLAALLATWDPKLYFNGDNIDYMMLAREVRGGDLWPSEKYPPLFPILLAPVQALFGLRLGPQKGLVLAFAVGSLLLVAALLRRRRPAAARPWLLFALMAAVPVVEFSHYVMSEIPFLFFLLGAVLALERLAERTEPRDWRVAIRDRRTWAVAAWLMAAFYTRSAGAAAIAGALAWLAASRRSRDGLILAGACGLLAIPWLVAAGSATGGSPYLRQLALVNPYYPELGALGPLTLMERVAENARGYLANLAPTLAFPLLYSSTYSPPAVQKTFAPLWLSLPLAVPLVLGWARALLRRDAAAFLLGASLLLLLVWPAVWISSRFLVPLVPFLVLFWWEGWAWPTDGKAPRLWPRVRAVVLALLVLLSARNLVFYAQESRAYPPEWMHYFDLLHAARDRLPREAVIVDRKPGFVTFVTERRAQMFPREGDPERMWTALRRAGATHVVLPPLPYDDINRYLRPALEGGREHYRLVHATPEPAAYLLEIEPVIP